jgi:Fe-S-cluster containining protein
MPQDFEQALAAAEAAETHGPKATPPPLEGDLEAFRDALRFTHNLGQSNDAADLYWVVDQMVERVRAAYPGAVCKRGCSGCCDSATAVFDVTQTEWTLIKNHMATHWNASQHARFRERFAQEHSPRLTTYRFLQAVWHFEPVADRVWARKNYRCPFLEEGACSIYEARPLACRMYGFFALLSRLKRHPSIYGCRLQADHFEKVQANQILQLPAARTVWTRAEKLTRKPFWRISARPRILPLWVAQTPHRASGE